MLLNAVGRGLSSIEHLVAYLLLLFGSVFLVLKIPASLVVQFDRNRNPSIFQRPRVRKTVILLYFFFFLTCLLARGGYSFWYYPCRQGQGGPPFGAEFFARSIDQCRSSVEDCMREWCRKISRSESGKDFRECVKFYTSCDARLNGGFSGNEMANNVFWPLVKILFICVSILTFPASMALSGTSKSKWAFSTSLAMLTILLLVLVHPVLPDPVSGDRFDVWNDLLVP